MAGRSLVGCGGAAGTPGGGGGNGGGGGGGGNGGGSGLLTGDQVVASMGAVSAYMDSLTPGSVDELNASLLAFLKAHPDYINAGVSDDGVWGTLANGGTYLVLTNRVPQPGEADLTSVADALAAGSDVPKNSLKALLINAMGSAFANEASAIRPALNARAYTTTLGSAALDDLRSLGLPAVFYLSAHGGTADIPTLDANGHMVKNAAGEVVMVTDYGVSTSTEATAAAIQARMGDFEKGLIVAGRMVEDLVGGSYVRHDRFMVTSRWVTLNWQFAPDSLVWMSSCSGMSAGAAPFLAACQAKSAGLYVGWTDPVPGPAALAGAKFAIDRLLGANVLAPKEDPPQRAFDYEKVWADLAARNLDQSQVTDDVTGVAIPGRVARLTYQAKAGTNFGLLAPSIRYCLVDESQAKVHLYGTFGTPAENERAVLIDGLEASVDSWAKDEIVCILPRNGQGSKGEVKVSVRAHDSNVRRITEWNFDVTYTYDDKDQPGLRMDGHYLVRFRGDIGEYRDQPHETPKKPVRCMVASPDSLASIAASGSNSSGGCTTTWSGSADYLATTMGQGQQPDPLLIAVLKVDTDTKAGALGLALGSMHPALYTSVEACPGDPPVTNQFAVIQSVLEDTPEFPIEYPGSPAVPLQLPAMVFSFGDNYSTPGHKFIDVALNQLTMEWPAVTATWPPDTAAARGES